MGNCENIIIEYDGKTYHENEHFIVHDYKETKILHVPPKLGSYYLEVTHYGNTNCHLLGYYINDTNYFEIFPKYRENYYFYHKGIEYPMKYNFPVKTTIGLGISYKTKSFYVIYNDIIERYDINIDDYSTVRFKARAAIYQNISDEISVNFGSSPFIYRSLDFIPYCTIHLLVKSCFNVNYRF